MSKIKILQIVDGFRMGGAENKLWELIGHLDRDKFQSMVANVGPSGPLENRFVDLGLPVVQCQRKHSFDISPLFKLRKIMIEHQIDIVQTTLFWADFIGIVAAKMARVPVIISWETVTHDRDPYHYKWQRRAGYKIATQFVDRIVAVSNEIKESLIRRRGLPEELIHVIHYGVDLEKFFPNGTSVALRQELGFRDGEVTLAVIARLEKVKGHQYFIQAFHQLAQRHRNVSTIFVGSGSELGNLENMVHEAGLDGRIRFLGIRKDVSEILNAIDILVLPSIAGEGLPNVVLEAMACGKPVIATTVGGTGEAIRHGENGFLVPPGDVTALEKAIEKIISERDKIPWYGNRARSIAEHEFSLQKQITSFENLYNSLYQHKVSLKRRPPLP
ncbi:MAG: glycosyltransferase [bacterium]